MNTLRQLGNVTHDEYAQAYYEALRVRITNLCKLQVLQSMPWYDRIFLFGQARVVIRDIHKEQEFLAYCNKNIVWILVQDETTSRSCFALERIQQNLLRETRLGKALNLKLYE